MSSAPDRSEPATPINQPRIFGPMEPSVTPLSPSDCETAGSEYKWNGIDQLLLPGGETVWVLENE